MVKRVMENSETCYGK